MSRSLSVFGLSENRIHTPIVEARKRILKTLHDARSQALRGRLRATREAAALTQADLAQRLKKPQSFVSKYETGERRLDVIEYGEICAALGIDPISLLADVLSTEAPAPGRRDAASP